jgi:hypothetical protein
MRKKGGKNTLPPFFWFLIEELLAANLKSGPRDGILNELDACSLRHAFRQALWQAQGRLRTGSPVIFVILLILSAWTNHLKQALPF